MCNCTNERTNRIDASSVGWRSIYNEKLKIDYTKAIHWAHDCNPYFRRKSNKKKNTRHARHSFIEYQLRKVRRNFAMMKCDFRLVWVCVCGASWHFSMVIKWARAQNRNKFAIEQVLQKLKKWLNCTDACKLHQSILPAANGESIDHFHLNGTAEANWNVQLYTKNFHEKWNLIGNKHKHVCYWWNPLARKTTTSDNQNNNANDNDGDNDSDKRTIEKLVFRVYLTFNGSEAHKKICVFFIYFFRLLRSFVNETITDLHKAQRKKNQIHPTWSWVICWSQTAFFRFSSLFCDVEIFSSLKMFCKYLRMNASK